MNNPELLQGFRFYISNCIDSFSSQFARVTVRVGENRQH